MFMSLTRTLTTLLSSSNRRNYNRLEHPRRNLPSALSGRTGAKHAESEALESPVTSSAAAAEGAGAVAHKSRMDERR
jgi:hypothetical protein